MSEREPGWRASVDGVVSDFDEVTHLLRHRQRQALRAAWTMVGVSTLAVAGLIVLNLPQGAPGGPAVRTPVVALLDPAATPPLSPDGTPPFVSGIGPLSPPPPTTGPVTTAPAPVADLASAPRRPRPEVPAITPTTLVASAGPVTAVVAPSTGDAPPSPSDSSDPSRPPGLVDGLVSGVAHLLG